MERLPNNDFSPFYPFGGVVLNFNVTTRLHRDKEDQDLCMILVLSDCVGGGLGIVEPGVLADLENGDMMAFASADITHFNLDFKGKRVSMVFHSDRSGKGWVKDLNGWRCNATVH